MRSRLSLALVALLALGLGVQSVFAAHSDQNGHPYLARPHQAANPTPTTVPQTGPATSVPTPVPALAVSAVPEVLPNPPGVTARFTVTFLSQAPGQGEVYFGTSCDGLVEVSTRDVHPGTTQHAVVVAGNDLPGTVGGNGIQAGTTYYFETVNVTAAGAIIDNNGGKCFLVTVPTTATTSSVRVLTATILGANEIGGGEPGATGGARIILNLSTNTVCWSLSALGVTLPATAAHIHQGAAGVDGPVVVPLTAPGASGTSTGCSTISASLAADIASNPGNYYVNVHTTDYPGGALRGQLG